MDEILAGPGMSGFVSILDPPEAVPHLQALVDDIKDIPLLTVPEGRFQSARRSEPAPAGRPAKQGGANIIHLPRRDSDAPDETGPAGVEEEVLTQTPPWKRPEHAAEAERPPTPGDERDPGGEREPGAERDTRPIFPALASTAEPAARRHHVRRAVLAQDGHSSGEEVLYQSLWNCRYARQESKETKLVTIGWKAMSKLARLTPRNTRRNCQSLMEKLAVEQLSEENSRESIGRTYRLFSYKAILERRRAAGMEWITRSRGVNFVPSPATAATEPAATISKAEPASQPGLFGNSPGRESGTELAPDAKRDPGAKRDTGSAAALPAPIVKTLREYLPDVDDASVVALIHACREKTPDATEEEIHYFVRIKADLMHRMGTVKSPMGFLKTSVPRCFEGESFRQFREAEAKRREAAALQESAQEEEVRRFEEEQRAVLHDPASSEEDRRFARHYLGISPDRT
jgi:hypothetical protein